MARSKVIRISLLEATSRASRAGEMATILGGVIEQAERKAAVTKRRARKCIRLVARRLTFGSGREVREPRPAECDT
jgi:hypothetical protein